MKVAFIFPPYSHKLFAENLHVVDQQFGVFPPLNLLYAAAILERAGHQVLVIDAASRRIDMAQALREVEEFDPALLAFNVITYMYRQTLEWIVYMKKHTNLPVIIGGRNMTYYPYESMVDPHIDFGILGEANSSLPIFMEAFAAGEGLEQVPGLAYKRNGEVVMNPPPPLVPFDDYPFPARHLVPNENYFSHVSQLKNFTIGLTSLGCPHKCIFCVMAEMPYRVRSPRNVLDEIIHCYDTLGIREFDFFDSAMFENRTRILELCRLIGESGRRIEWSARSRVDSLDEELLAAMARSGCVRLFFGIESADRKILKAIKKDIDPQQITHTIEMTRSHGIRPLGFFMVGNPHEDLSTVIKSVRLGHRLKLDYAQFSRTIAKPKTLLDTQIIESTGYDYWSEYVLGNIGEKRLPSPWTDLTERQIEVYTKVAYILFYFRPLYAARILLKARSFGEIVRYAKVAFMMLFHFNRDSKHEIVPGRQPRTAKANGNT
ncbi:B12-binding domain-containing radical SAM protein [bacterium]|nr:B12-binding domain-containing radical SAM protein [candidate division CSSED10-310 bacterium]